MKGRREEEARERGRVGGKEEWLTDGGMEGRREGEWDKGRRQRSLLHHIRRMKQVDAHSHSPVLHPLHPHSRH